MVDGDLDAARKALDELIRSLARISARAVHDLGVEFDVDDPRVARWLLLTSFEAQLTPAARSTSQALLALVEEASKGEGRFARKKTGKRGQLAFVTWDDLVASAANCPAPRGRRKRG